MKTKALLLLLSMGLFLSCSNDSDDLEQDSANFEVEIPGNINDTGIGSDDDLYGDDLMAGQYYDSGDVVVSQVGDNIVITYATQGDWQLDATHVYVGDLESLPINGAGNPNIGLFPYAGTHPAGTTLVIYTAPAPNPGECIIVSAHAEVTNNDSGLNETAWANGFGVSENESSWAMAFEVCL